MTGALHLVYEPDGAPKSLSSLYWTGPLCSDVGSAHLRHLTPNLPQIRRCPPPQRQIWVRESEGERQVEGERLCVCERERQKQREREAVWTSVAMAVATQLPQVLGRPQSPGIMTTSR